MVRAFMLLGGMTGTAFEAYIPFVNTGMLGLRDQIVALGVPVSVYPWGDWQSSDADIFAWQGTAVVIGYSGGGSRAAWMGNALLFGGRRRVVDLMVGYDPSPAWQMQAIGPNVHRAICYYNTAPFFFGLGGGQFTLAPGNDSTSLTTITIAEQHLAVQYDSSLHAQTIVAIKNLL